MPWGASHGEAAAHFGVVLHRSEVIAHSQELLERKGDIRTSRSVRRKGEGFGGFAQPGKAFQPLGAPQELDRLNSKLHKDPKQRGLAAQQHPHDAKGRRAELDFDAALDGGEGDWGPGESRNAGGSDATAERKAALLANLPHGLWGKDLPRCRTRRHMTDGFDALRQSVRNSEVRMRRVRHDAGEGFGMPVPTLEAMLPTREQYTEGGRALASSLDATASQPTSAREAIPPPPEARLSRAPLTARGASGRPLVSPAREVAPRVPPSGHKLPSLADVLASSGGPGSASVAGPSDGAYAASRYREQIERLLGYGLSGGGPGREDRPRAKELGAARKGQEVDRWKRTEKLLEKRGRELLERFRKVCEERPEAQRAEDGEEAFASAAEAERPGSGLEQARGASPGSDRAGEEEGVERRRLRTAEDVGGAGVGGVARGGEVVDAPVLRLRSALYSYQDSRDKRRDLLHSALQATEANRPNTWRKFAASGSPRGEPDDGEAAAQKAQLRCYHDLLAAVREEGEKVPGVAHFVLDTVRAVLEQDRPFRAEHFYAMLGKVDSAEMDRMVLGIVRRVAASLCDLSGQEVLAWLEQHRGEVPQHFHEGFAAARVSGADDGELARGHFDGAAA